MEPEGCLQSKKGPSKTLWNNFCLGKEDCCFENQGPPIQLLSSLDNLLQGGTAFTRGSGFVANESSSLTAIGALYRILSIPVVFGPSFQNCGYHVDCLLPTPRKGSISSKSQKAPIAVYGI